MNKNIIIISLAALCMSSCVTLGKYEALESRNAQLRREYNTSQSELSDLRDENANLQRQNQSLNTQITDLNDFHSKLQDSISVLKRDMDNLKMGYDTVIENYNQRITGQSQDLTRTNNLLAARTKELNDKETAFQLKEAAFQAKETELRAKQAELERKEAETRKALEAKERELENLRTKLNNALVGFADKGLNVETRDGKVYVSMDSKLLFPSASWTVSKEGIEATTEQAKLRVHNADAFLAGDLNQVLQNFEVLNPELRQLGPQCHACHLHRQATAETWTQNQPLAYRGLWPCRVRSQSAQRHSC